MKVSYDSMRISMTRKLCSIMELTSKLCKYFFPKLFKRAWKISSENKQYSSENK